MLKKLLLLGFIGLISACAQEKEPDDTLSSPIVIEEVPNASNNNPNCLLLPLPLEEESIILEVLPVTCQEELTESAYIIRSVEEYEDFVLNLACTQIDNSGLPPEATPFLVGQDILVLRTLATGCDQGYRAIVIEDPIEKTYTYTMYVKECGACRPLVTTWHWVSVPNIPDDYEVVFEVKRI